SGSRTSCIPNAGNAESQPAYGVVTTTKAPPSTDAARVANPGAMIPSRPSWPRRPSEARTCAGLDRLAGSGRLSSVYQRHTLARVHRPTLVLSLVFAFTGSALATSAGTSGTKHWLLRLNDGILVAGSKTACLVVHKPPTDLNALACFKQNAAES